MSRTPPSRRADFAAFRSLTTRWKDNDAYGHINNASYYSFIDTAITLLAVSFLLVSRRFGKPVKLGLLLFITTTTGYAVVNNLNAMQELGLFSMGVI